MNWIIYENKKDGKYKWTNHKAAVGLAYGKPLVTIWRRDWTGIRGPYADNSKESSRRHIRWEIHFNLFGRQKIVINENNHDNCQMHRSTENSKFFDTEYISDFNNIMRVGKAAVNEWRSSFWAEINIDENVHYEAQLEGGKVKII